VLKNYKEEVDSMAPPRQRMKVIGSDIDKTPQKGYYHIKKPDPEILSTYNPSVVGSPTQYMPQIQAFVDLTLGFTERMAIKKNKLVPFAEVTDGKFVSKSGSRLLCSDTGNVIQEFEFAKDSLENLLWGLQRHTSARQEPDPGALREFAVMANECLTELTDRILVTLP